LAVSQYFPHDGSDSHNDERYMYGDYLKTQSRL